MLCKRRKITVHLHEKVGASWKTNYQGKIHAKSRYILRIFHNTLIFQQDNTNTDLINTNQSIFDNES